MKKCAWAYQLCKLAEGCQYPQPGGDWFKLRQIAEAARHCSQKGARVKMMEYQNLAVADILERKEGHATVRRERRSRG